MEELAKLVIQNTIKVRVNTKRCAWKIFLNKEIDGLLDEETLSKVKEYFLSEVAELKEIELVYQTTDMLKSKWQQEMEREFIKKLNSKTSSAKNKEVREENGVVLGKHIKSDPVKIKDLQQEERYAVVSGRVFGMEIKELKSGRYIVIFNITDNTDSITAKQFLEKEKVENISKIKDGFWVKIGGAVQHDRYSQELVLLFKDVNLIQEEKRCDNAREKRVELHLHTKMSAMDGVLDVSDAIKRAAEWGHKAIAITDHGVVQAFPEAYKAAKKAGIKVIYGLEGYLINDGIPIVERLDESKWKDVNLQDVEFVVFDLETTGLTPSSNEIIEIGAVKLKGFEIVDEFSTFINPGRTIPAEIVRLTGIDDSMVVNALKPKEALKKFYEFIGDAVLVAHNAAFDMGFIRVHFDKYLNTTPYNAVLDTLLFARSLIPNLKNHKLDTVCSYLGVSLEKHHRALDDAKAALDVFKALLKKCDEENRNIKQLNDINKLTVNVNLDKLRPYHVTILAKNKVGLKNLYKLVTLSHLKYYYKKPRIPKSALIAHREGLLIGTACERGELFDAVISGASKEKISEIVSFYDFLEIQPAANSEFLVKSGKLNSMEELKNIYKTIYDFGKQFKKPVVATGDVHFLDPEDAIYREILMHGQSYEDAGNQAPLYFKTTDEMLEEFSYLGKDAAYEVVVANSLKIAEQIEELTPVPQNTYHPKIEGAEKIISDMAVSRAKDLYGDPLPDIVKNRLDKELKAIIENGFAVLYLIAHKLVKKSLEDGYLVGSRGSVGSSLVATLTDITEVNPLPPHYRCPKCKYSEFITDGSFGCGADMPDKNCSYCKEPLIKDGYDIPFEVFMGFEGDKVPDIDLNFSGEYQPKAHKYTEKLFGEKNVFRAGTISTIAEKTAYGFVKKYLEEKGLIKREAEIKRLVKGCAGVKRTTGQHPGGTMVVPKEIDVYEVTPLQYPADDKKSGVITTHFDYHSIHDCLVKLDILGHDDPTVIKMLEDLTGVDVSTIKFDDKETLSLFSSTKALGVKEEEIRSAVGTYAIPEFGTKFVRQMLADTKPSTFSDLIRISGFSHGTDVWLNNAQDLIKNGICKLSEAISARDDIMTYLIHKGMEPKTAFKIMEKVRKGKGVSEEDAKAMEELGVPDWYIESCRKIKYMFPKAHATAYVVMAFRIAWFKVNYPVEFYAVYFSIRADDFDAELMVKGKHAILNAIEQIKSKGQQASTKEKNLLTVLEVALEMYARGIKFRRVDLMESDALKFKIVGKDLLPPLIALQGVGEAAARSIAKAREEAAFTSIEDLQNRARVPKTVIEALKQHGCLDGISETNQLALF
ncbi:PolC-type DNA polymerase III [Peptococcaceae bacterium]|nr:PolC-type DNA polymerase III [Peptococcaceae bacterium]